MRLTNFDIFQGSLAFTLVVFFASCKSPVVYDVQMPPRLEVAENSSFLFFNRYDPDVLDYTIEKKVRVHQVGLDALLLTLRTSFQNDSMYSLVMLDSSEKGTAYEHFTDTIAVDVVNEWCVGNQTDYLITLDYYFTDFLMEKVIDEDPEGGGSAYNDTDLLLECGFTLYSRNGEVFDRGRIEEVMDYRDRPALTKWISIAPSIGKAGDEINELSILAGQHYHGLFHPTWEQWQDFYYSGKGFRELRPLMKQQKWKEAESLLLELADSDDPKIAGRASSNLELVRRIMANTSDYPGN